MLRSPRSRWMQIAWLVRNHFLVHRSIVFSALPPVRRGEGLFARALFFLEGSASDLITATGPTSSYHHLKGKDFSLWMTPEGPVYSQYRNRGTHTCPFPGRAPCMSSAGAKWGPTAIWGIFLYVTAFYLSHLCWKYIFTYVTYCNLIGVLFPLWQLHFALFFQ